MRATDKLEEPAKLGPDTAKKDTRIKVLHLSDTSLSGSPVRISGVINKYSTTHVSRHITWVKKLGYRQFDTDIVGEETPKRELLSWLDWADVIHYHNRYSRQEIFEHLDITPPNKPSVIQMHSPRNSENFTSEVRSGLPIIVVGQYQPRQWPEAAFIVPNIVDIWDERYMPLKNKPLKERPIISYAPSNTSASGWDNKGYHLVAPLLKRMKLSGEIQFQLIIDCPHSKVLELKRGADLGIDEIATGSYHLSSLEYLSMGVPCIANIDAGTQDILLRMTGAKTLPWIVCNKDTFPLRLRSIISNKSWAELGVEAREWMETYWQPSILIKQYEEVYESLT